MEEAQLLTRAEWAREQGFSKPYVTKLVKRGKIVLVDGKIDPVDAGRRLAALQNPVKQAQRLTVITELTKTPKSTQELTEELTNIIEFRPRPSPVDALPTRCEDPSDRDEGQVQSNGKPEHLSDQLLRARIKREKEEGRLKELERKRREGELVDAEEVRDEQVRRATEEREALLNWPPRIAAQMAAELQIEDSRLLPVLRKYVRQHLAERSKQ